MKQNSTQIPTKSALLFKVLISFTLFLVFYGSLLLIPAGSLSYWNAWLMLGCMLVLMFPLGIYLYITNPALLEKRFTFREKERKEKRRLKFSIPVVMIAFIIPGLDYRFHWSHVPLWCVILGLIMLFAGYIVLILVMKQNSYASRVIEIQAGQKLIDTGLYSIIRHPLYLGSLIVYGGMPLLLGSWYMFIPIAFFPIILYFRIKNEERILTEGLPGYREYTRRVKYRLIPGIW